MRNVGDFVEEERAAIGHFEAAHAVHLGVGEGALHVAEELALEDALGQSAGVDGDQRTGGAQRNRMQRLRHQPFAGAVLAGDEHVGVGGAHARDHVEHRPHGRRLRDQLREALGAQGAILGFQALSFAQRAAQLDLRFEDGREARVVPGLLNEIARAAAHGLHGQLHRSPGRHHDHRQGGIEALDAVEQLETFLAGGGVARVVEVHQDDVEIARFDGIDGRGGRVDGLGLIAFALHQEAQRFEDVGLIVGDEDARRVG